MAKKTAKEITKLAVLFGGRSGEHEVSIISARSMMAAVDGGKYEVIPIYISPEGSWYFWAGFMQGVPRPGPDDPAYTPVADPGRRAFLVRYDGGDEIEADVVFPLLHGHTQGAQSFGHSGDAIRLFIPQFFDPAHHRPSFGCGGGHGQNGILINGARGHLRTDLQPSQMCPANPYIGHRLAGFDPRIH